MSGGARPNLVCEHVLLAPSVHRVWFTGEGLAHHWVCDDCAKRHPEAPAWRPIDEDWWARHGDDSSRIGVVGSPEVLSRATDLAFTHEDVPLALGAGIVDLRPCPVSASGCWFLLSDGALSYADLSTGEVTRTLRPPRLRSASRPGCGLCVSPAGDFAAIFQASGSRGAVIDLADGRVVRRLRRGRYCSENSLFPVAFARRDGRTLLVTGADWNRLDLVDVASNRVLSERASTRMVEGAPTPEHYLDYFHGSLVVSPDGARIIDSGWIWHPVGEVRAWSLDAWRDNPWESEDGPTLRRFAPREYFWDGPACWVDDTTVALWGWGDDDEWLIPAALLVDAREGRLLRWFPGPRVRRPKALPPRTLADSLVFDGHLFAVDDEAGTTVWDVVTGERLHADPSLKPTRHHRGARAFLTPTAEGVRVSRLAGASATG